MGLETAFESVRTFTQDEFAHWVRLRREPERFELLNRRIVMNPPSGWPLGEISAILVAALVSHVRRERLGRVFGSDQGFEFPTGDTVGPDASFVSTSRWEEAAPHEEGAFLRLVPELAVEILSPSTASRDRGEKRAIYARNAVAEYWILDPTARRLQVFSLEGDAYEAPAEYQETDELVSHVLPGLRLRLAELLP